MLEAKQVLLDFGATLNKTINTNLRQFCEFVPSAYKNSFYPNELLLEERTSSHHITMATTI